MPAMVRAWREDNYLCTLDVLVTGHHRAQCFGR